MTGEQRIHDIRFPGESQEYRNARDDLLATEIELRRINEAAAQRRRKLPVGGAVPTGNPDAEPGPQPAYLDVRHLPIMPSSLRPPE